MITRWQGVRVVWTHPKKGVLDTESFVNTVIGSICRAFVRDGELLGVARILDADAAAMMAQGEYDTSPAIILGEDSPAPIELENGDRLLVERNPTFVDHLAICARGVWSRGGAPGVETAH
jgi:hypothetical protein